MSPERREQVKYLFDSLCDATTDFRDSYFQSHTIDPDVRAETERLLRAYDSDPSYLETAPELLAAEALAVPPAQDPTYETGDVLSGRFRVIAFLGQGGMGEVYEAEDLVEGTQVAVKTLRHDLSANPDMRARFRQEVALAKLVTDPHVCRINALHSNPVGANAPQLLLSMELLSGERLSAKIGTLALDEVLPIARQIAVGLAAAHRAGVIHRDLKTSNIMLTRESDGTTRAVIMDFGIALPFEPGVSSLNRSGFLSGTVEYMAPEQFVDKAVPASDVYAFGVILHEMLTARKPQGPGSSLRLLNPRIPRLLDKLVLRCLAHNPAARYANGQELLTALDRAAPRRTWPETVALVFALFCAVLGGTYLGRSVSDIRGLLPPSSRRVVAVLDFQNLSGRRETAYLARALATALTSELATSSHLRVISGEDVARAQADLGLANVTSFSRDTLQKLKTNLEANMVISGSYLVSDSKVHVYAVAQDASSGAELAALSEEGFEPDLPGLFARLGRSLETKLGLAPDADKVAASSAPANLDALKFYSEGMRLLTSFQPRPASDSFQKAIAAQADYAPAHAALARCLSALGFEERAKLEAKRAYELSSQLNPQDRLQIEAEYYDAFGEYRAAADSYQKLVQMAPDRIDYRILLAGEMPPKEGAAMLEQFRRSSSRAGNNPQLDLALVRLYNRSSDYPLLETAANRVIARGKQIGASSLVEEAEIFLAGALRIMGRTHDAENAYEDAKRLSVQLGDESGQARAFRGLALIKYYAGDLDASRALYEQALAAFRAVGNESGIAMVLNGLAMVESATGQLKRAQDLYTQSLSICEDIHDGTGTGRALNNLGYISAHLGDLPAARSRLEASLAVYEREDAHWGLSVSLNNLGDVLAFQGDLQGAEKDELRSLQEARQAHDRGDEASSLYSLATVRQFEGNLGEAQHLFQQSYDLRASLNEKENRAASAMALGRLYLLQNKPASALQFASEAVSALNGSGNPNSRAQADAILASAEAASGHREQARAIIQRAQHSVAHSEDVPARLTVELEAARVLGLSGDEPGKQRALQKLHRDAAQLGFRPFATVVP